MRTKKTNKPTLDIGFFKEIPLYPTRFSVDIWVCNNQDNLAKYFKKRYGASVEYYKEEVAPNQVANLHSTIESELNGEVRIVMNVIDWDLNVIGHELIHIIYHLDKICNLGIDFHCQEWVSYLFEYLFERCKNDGSFKSCDSI